MPKLLDTDAIKIIANNIPTQNIPMVILEYSSDGVPELKEIVWSDDTTYTIKDPTVKPGTMVLAVFNPDTHGATTTLVSGVFIGGREYSGIGEVNIPWHEVRLITVMTPTNPTSTGIVFFDMGGVDGLLSTIQKCTATSNDVMNGKTFMSKDNIPKIGNITLTGTATIADVLSGKTFYSTDPKNRLTGILSPGANITELKNVIFNGSNESVITVPRNPCFVIAYISVDPTILAMVMIAKINENSSGGNISAIVDIMVKSLSSIYVNGQSKAVNDYPVHMSGIGPYTITVRHGGISGSLKINEILQSYRTGTIYVIY